MYYWRIRETGYIYDASTSFNAVVLKRSGSTDKYLFQESDLVLVLSNKTFFYHYYYFPDENEQDMRLEMLLPNSQIVNYIDTQYPRIANAKELDDIELKIDQFSNVLNEYNTLYLKELNYDRDTVMIASIGLALAPLCFWGAVTAEDNRDKVGWIGLGALFSFAGIIKIGEALKVKPRRAELKKLESTLKDIINTN